MYVLKCHAYWGKADKRFKYHLLPYHCLDVAAAADAYLRAHPHLLNTMAIAFALPKEVVRALLLFLIALHDLGKFSICFQSLVPEIVVKARTDATLRSNSDYRHDVLGQAVWQSTLLAAFIDDYVIWPKKPEYIMEGINVLMAASTGHHGQPVYIDRVIANRCMMAFDAHDIEAVRQFYEAIARLFLGDKKIDLSHFQEARDFNKICKRVSWWLSGLTTLADWLGSNVGYFEYHDDKRCLQNYWNSTQKQAEKAVIENGLNEIQVKPNQDFQTLFNKETPRPLQQTVATIPLAEHEQLFILEDVTGAGKTEAALLLAYRMMQQGLAEGMYFALPTMATANGIYERLQSLYQNFFYEPEMVSLILAHANNKMQKNFHESIVYHPGVGKERRSDLTTASAFCNAWLADNRKKCLLANIGVGTIDQALQTVLKNKHQSLRLLGLFHKILVVDEVHAYDAYMQELLCNLLRFHAGSGGSAILLSATLTEKIRKNLIEAFYSARASSHAVELQAKKSYPLLTHAYYEQIDEITVKPHVLRQTHIEMTDDKGQVEKYILDRLQQGYCVCWIRNTVYDAIAAYEEFKTLYLPESITLFHARFTLGDRFEIEDKVKKLFGEKSLQADRAGQLLIATQVVEQSLDIDFDFMVTDLAPIDLIIQRIGRLQRHFRGDRPSPTLLIYGPLPEDEVTGSWYKKFFPKAAGVYQNHAQLWMGAKLLLAAGKLVMPDDARELMETVYGSGDTLSAPASLQDKADKHFAKENASRNQADWLEIKLNNGYVRDDLIWPTDLRATTRLSDVATVNIYMAKYKNGILSPWHNYSPEGDAKLNWHVSSLSIAVYHLDGLTEAQKNTDFMIDEILNQLPDRGEYSIVLFYDVSEDRYYLINEEKLYCIDKIGYSKDRGLTIKS